MYVYLVLKQGYCEFFITFVNGSFSRVDIKSFRLECVKVQQIWYLLPIVSLFLPKRLSRLLKDLAYSTLHFVHRRRRRQEAQGRVMTAAGGRGRRFIQATGSWQMKDEGPAVRCLELSYQLHSGRFLCRRGLPEIGCQLLETGNNLITTKIEKKIT